MTKAESTIEGVLHLPVEDHGDPRGSFREIFREQHLPVSFVQANHSRSKAGVLRGLHYHRRQSDLWYVVSGELLLGCADLRTRAERPAIWSVALSSEKPSAVLIPPGVAHGFAALTDVDLVYWVTHGYDASDEYGVAWDDPTIDLDWRIDKPILSERDSTNERLDWTRVPPFS